MPSIIKTQDLQIRIKANVYKKACQLFEEANKERWNLDHATPNQVKSVFRKAYDELAKAHPRTKWLNPIDNPKWITKLDYICARGGRPMAIELNNIVKQMGGEELIETDTLQSEFDKITKGYQVPRMDK